MKEDQGALEMDLAQARFVRGLFVGDPEVIAGLLEDMDEGLMGAGTKVYGIRFHTDYGRVEFMRFPNPWTGLALTQPGWYLADDEEHRQQLIDKFNERYFDEGGISSVGLGPVGS